MVLENEDWWNPGLEDTVLSGETTMMGDPYVVVHVPARGPRMVGELGAAHGIKMTVGEILPLEQMPSAIDEVICEPCKPNTLTSMKNITRDIE